MPTPTHTPRKLPRSVAEGLFEALEARQLLAFTVLNLNDAGAGSLRQAIADANAAPGADVIDFGPGVTGTITLASRLQVTGAVTITGPGASALTVSGNNATGVLSVGPGIAVTVSNLTLANGSDPTVGGILNAGALTLTNATLSGNTGTAAGGIFSTGPVTLNTSTFSGNTTSGTGAGGLSILAPLVVEGSTFTNNTAPSGDAGAIYISGQASNINASTFTGNSSAAGGAIYSDSGVATVTNSTFSGNTGIDGGGILASGTLTITGSTISGNNAQRGGGVFLTGASGTLNVQNSTISGNTATQFGGGLFCVSNNTLNVENCTITLNTGTSDGGGIFSNSSTGTVRSTIVAANTSTDIEGSMSLGVGSANNLIGNSGSAAGLVNGVNGNLVGVSANLGPLTNNGGLTFTHAPLAGSPAIGAGANLGGFTFDQRGTGFPRLAGGAVDIGAIEFSTSVLPTTGALTAAPTTVSRGGGVTLTLNGVVPGQSPVARVDFFRDLNDNGLIDSGELIGSDINGLDGNGFSFLYSVPVDTVVGNHRFLAKAVADDLTESVPEQTTVAVTGAVPTLGTLTPSSSEHEQGREGFTLTANNVDDSDGDVTIVRFYVDLNNNNAADAGEQIGADTDGSNGYSYTADPGQLLELPLGQLTFLSVAFDNEGQASAPSTTTARMLFPTFTTPAHQVVGTANAADASRVAALNVGGHIIVFEQGWVVADLQVATSAPDAIDDPVIWTDPKDGLLYVSAPSAAGLLLFTRAAAGTWTTRNLSVETGVALMPTHGLTQFTAVSQDSLVVVAGLTEAGRLVMFQQTGQVVPGVGPAFQFLDLSADLESQGMATPQVDSLISYVPTWDSWHLAGIDDNGKIQSVWINRHVDGFTKWRTDDLTAITRAPAIEGQLAVTLTSWGGINLTGLDSGGNLQTTWWVPEFGGEWRVNNLTSQFGGAPLVGGNVSGYTTPWGGLNYVGLDGSGKVVVYWWAPAVTDWSVTPLLPDSVAPENRPSGVLTSSSSPAGTLNVYGASSSGDVLRLWWQPGGAPDWTAENLTDVAVRQ